MKLNPTPSTISSSGAAIPSLLANAPAATIETTATTPNSAHSMAQA
jgi:hypothetical protein